MNTDNFCNYSILSILYFFYFKNTFNSMFNKIMNNNSGLKFMDFCAGIGAGRLGLQKLGLECVAFSEINPTSEATYREFYGQSEKNYGDLMKINTKDLPDFDLLIAGFPCQSFSVIGQRKGIEDKRGQVIFGLTKIMREKDVKYFILENVKGLLNHESGNTMRVVLDELESAGYKVYWKVLNSLNHGVPQMRERVYFIGVRKDLVVPSNYFIFPKIIKSVELKDYLIDNVELEFSEKKKSYDTFLRYLDNKYNKDKFEINDFLSEEFLVIDTRQSDLRLYRNKVPTLRTGRHGILYVRNNKFRKLTGYESLLLQGFPKELADKVKSKILDIHLLSQAGNAMTVNVIEALGKNLLQYINQSVWTKAI